jgi:hypothetical protein
MSRRLACLLALSLSLAGAQAGERPAPRRLCPGDLPDGAHLPPQPGCSSPAGDAAKAPHDGFTDLGNGTSLRISGRASADYGVRR